MGELVSNQDWLARIQDRRKGSARLPELRLALTDFILTYHPGLPTFKGAEKYGTRCDRSDVLYDAAYYGSPHYAWPLISPSALKVSVPLRHRAHTEIRVSSSAFPVDQSKVKNIMFTVEVPDLDMQLILGPSERPNLTKVISISRIREPFTSHTVIGSLIRSWPAWERSITNSDVDSVQSILTKKGLKITPEPQRIIREDY